MSQSVRAVVRSKSVLLDFEGFAEDSCVEERERIRRSLLQLGIDCSKLLLHRPKMGVTHAAPHTMKPRHEV